MIPPNAPEPDPSAFDVWLDSTLLNAELKSDGSITIPYDPILEYPYLPDWLLNMWRVLNDHFVFKFYYNWWESRDYPKGEGIYILLDEDLTPFYVGKTTDFRRRLNEHRLSNFYVNRSYVPHYVYYLVADRVPDPILRWAEKYFIEQLNPWVNRRKPVRR